MSMFRRSVNLHFWRLRWNIEMGSQCFELWKRYENRVWSFGIYWNRFFHPKCWWWWHNNGAIKGIDNCYDFTWNFFIFSFCYTNFDYWKYKKTAK